MRDLGKGALEFLTGTEKTATEPMYSDGVLTLGQPLYITDRNYLTVGDNSTKMQSKTPVQAPFIEGYLDEWNELSEYSIVSHANRTAEELELERYYIRVYNDELDFKCRGGFKFSGPFSNFNIATADRLGFVKLGSNAKFENEFQEVQSGKTYRVQVNDDGQLGVTLPSDGTLYRVMMHEAQSGTTYTIPLIEQDFTYDTPYTLKAKNQGGITITVDSNTINCNISGTANALVDKNKGNATTPVYINSNGKPVACTPYAEASVASATTATTASKATALVDKNIGGQTTPVYINSNGKPVACTAYAEATVKNLNGGTVNATTVTSTGNTSIANGALVASTVGDVTIKGNLIGKTGKYIQGFERVYSAVWNDYADALLRNPNTDNCEAGDIIAKSIGTNQYEKANQENKRLVVGVYSDTYGHLLGGKEGVSVEESIKDYLPVAVAGNVRVKVIGIVNEGDLITLSHINGVGMAIPCDTDLSRYIGTIVGKALETKTTNEISRISMQVMLK